MKQLNATGINSSSHGQTWQHPEKVDKSPTIYSKSPFPLSIKCPQISSVPLCFYCCQARDPQISSPVPDCLQFLLLSVSLVSAGVHGYPALLWSPSVYLSITTVPGLHSSGLPLLFLLSLCQELIYIMRNYILPGFNTLLHKCCQ